jgi:predicted ATPase
MIGHRLMGHALLLTGDIAEGLAHYDRAIALYDPVEHRPLATRFGVDIRVAILPFRSLALWVLGYPEAALADADHAIQDAREVGHAATLMYALDHATMFAHIHCGSYTAVRADLEELLALADEKSAAFWKAFGMMNQGCLFALTGKALDAVHVITSGMAAYRLTGASLHVPLYLPYLARAHAELGQFDDAWRCIDEAMTAAEAAKQKVYEAEVHRTAGEIALKVSDPAEAKAQAYFERALQIARQQQAKSWELRAAMSMARLWRDQGKPQQARELLAPVYDWFTEGFDTLDLKEAKRLLEQLAS